LIFQYAQIEALLKRLGKRRLLLNDKHRRLPGVKGYQPVENSGQSYLDRIFVGAILLVVSVFMEREISRKPGV
jgi:hypothetical protein